MTLDDEMEQEMFFAPEEETEVAKASASVWKVLIIDDDISVHDVTKLALKNVEFDGRPLQFLDAYSAAEARQILAVDDEIALALVDVVMETEHAGLDLVHHIRNELNNTLIRIVLRTGQPGQAPERTVISQYDINDYKEKTELTAQKLFSTVFTSLRSYRDLAALNANRRGLEEVIRASGAVFQISDLDSFIHGVLEQLLAVLYLGKNSLYLGCDCVAMESKADRFSVVAATGDFSSLVGKNPIECLNQEILNNVTMVLENKQSLVRGNVYVGYFCPRLGREDVIYVTGARPMSADDLKLIELFLKNVSIAYENALLRDEIEGTQRDMVYMLGEAVETRSRETGQHVRRVAEYCRLIAEGIGLPQRDIEILHIASPLHDFGKIGIPDSILHKPGKLVDDEWHTMQSHASMGEELLERSDREMLRAAAVLAGQHHERWDGSGYPRGLSGEAIHIFGRIGAIADVFDALAGRRCYKEPWPVEKILGYIKEQRGRQFDPVLVDWILANTDKMITVLEQYPDTAMPHH
jgi:response regulator RpfG family c-di-GMP phosphodiesterase